MSAATLSLSIPIAALTASGLPGDGRLFATAVMNGCPFHLEAVPVVDSEGLQKGADPISEARLEALALEHNASGFETLSIADRNYALFLIPFGL